MSRKQPKKQESQKASKLEKESLDPEELELDDVEDEEDVEGEEGEDEDEVDDEELEEEEFSLDQLSQAYAEVLKKRKGDEGGEAEKPATTSQAVSKKAEADDELDEPAKPKVDDNAACPISPESIIESILFVGCPKDVKLNSRKVAAILRDVSPKEVTKIVRELNARYEKENSAYRIESDGGVFKMILDPELLEFQQEFFGRNRKVRLSQSVIDVMAVVAYNQPCTKAQIEKIRSKPCGGVLSQLVKREILSVEPGKTDPKVKYYSTTDRFLDLFHLEEIADLPQSHEVSDIEELAD